MDYLRRLGAERGTPAQGEGSARASLPTPAHLAPEPAAPAPWDQRGASLEERLAAAVAEVGRLRAVAGDYYEHLEAAQSVSGALAAENGRLTEALKAAGAALEKERQQHAAAIADAQAGDDDEDRARYVRDLEKELTQWRRLGSQQAVVAPVQSVDLETSPPARGGLPAGPASPDGAASDATDAVATESSSALRQRIAMLEATLEAAKDEAALADARCAAAAQLCRRLEGQVQQLEAEATMRDDSLRAVFDDCRALREAAVAAEAVVATLETRLADAEGRVQSTREACEEAQAAAEREQSQHQQTRRLLAQAQRDAADRHEVLRRLQDGTAAITAPALAAAVASPPTTEAAPPPPAPFAALGAATDTVVAQLYQRVLVSEPLQQAWAQVRRREQALFGLGRRRRLELLGLAAIVVFVLYVAMSAVLFADPVEESSESLVHSLAVCERRLSALASATRGTTQARTQTEAMAASTPPPLTSQT